MTALLAALRGATTTSARSSLASLTAPIWSWAW